MYRITVKTHGKLNNVELGSRYCFRKKTAKYLINLFYNLSNCDIEVTKLAHLDKDIFAWVDTDENDPVFKYFDDIWVED